MQVIKRDGSRESVKIEKILHAVDRACRGLRNVEAIEIAKRTINGLHDGSTTEELDGLSISTAVMLMSESPAYSKVAARMLSESIHKEVGRELAFRDYLQNVTELGLVHDSVAGLAMQDIRSLEFAIRHERDDLFEYFGLKTVSDRYLLRHPKSRKLVERPQWLFMRVALGLSKNIEEAIGFYNVVSQFLYMPATPTLFNSGTRHPQMSSCYLLTIAEDSLEGIYKSITDCAKLSKFSGGIGIDWTPVRASGSLIRGTNGLSNGIIPFLKVFDSSVHAVNQGGKRKGAAAVYLEPWHADIEMFLELRNNTGSEERRAHNLNLAMWIPDLFMKRVEIDAQWSLFSPLEAPELLNTYGEEFELRYERAEREGKALKSVSARQLYARMMQTLAESGNGWMCFKDHSNKRSSQTAKEGNVIHSSNLCTEILEVTSAGETAVCNLGSINLPALVKTDGTFDFQGLADVSRTAMTYLDRVVDINFYPTQESKASNLKWRPVGLGVMGLQDVLFKLKLPYGSAEAKRISNKIAETIYFHAIQRSVELAQQNGPFPAFKDSRYAEGQLHVQLSEESVIPFPETNFDWNKLALEVRDKGIRNSLMIAVAPTATIASIVGSYESIEPQISNLFKRETLSGEFLQVNRYLVDELRQLGLWSEKIRSMIVENDGSIQNIAEIPDSLKVLYKTAWEISQKDLIDMAAERGVFIDQSQSLNLFMEEPNIGKMSSMYMYAWKRGVKTTYYMRSRAKTKIRKTTVSSQGEGAVEGQGGGGDSSIADLVSAATAGTLGAVDAVACSLENPDTCEACQ